MNISELVASVNQNLQEVMQNHGIQQENHEKIQNTVNETVQTELKNQVLAGNAQGLLELFNGNTQNQGSLLTTIISSLTSNLQQQGVQNQESQGIANSILPLILNMFSSPTSGTASNTNELVSQLGFSQDKGIMSFLGGLFNETENNQNQNPQNNQNNNEGIGGIINQIFN